jgi:hypothetical protein
MIERKGIAKTPREHFMQTAKDELEKFERKEIAFQQAERDERAMRLRLPSLGVNRAPGHNRARI